jgi:hypothetical protein
MSKPPIRNARVTWQKGLSECDVACFTVGHTK